MYPIERDCQTCGDPQYVVLLAVSEAIVSHRDLSSLFRDLAGRLHQVVGFDYLVLVRAPEPAPLTPVIDLPLEDDPAGLGWQTQQPLLSTSVSELGRWPRSLERVQPYGVQSLCFLPLTTVRQRLGTLVFSCKQPSAYDAADVGFLQHVANLVPPGGASAPRAALQALRLRPVPQLVSVLSLVPPPNDGITFDPAPHPFRRVPVR